MLTHRLDPKKQAAMPHREHEIEDSPLSYQRPTNVLNTKISLRALSPDAVIRLQQHIGNHAVIQLLSPTPRWLVSRQPSVGSIPIELKNSVNLQSLSEDALEARYDLIAQTLAQIAEPNQTTEEMALLEEEAGKIGEELQRRKALEAGRTFSSEAIEQMQDFFKQNAKKDKPDSCIVCLNKGMRLLLQDPKQKLTPESIEKTMALLQKSGRAGAVIEIGFKDKTGRPNKGSRRPEALVQSVWDTVIQTVGGDVGWSVFGMSLMDGNHSVTLTLDNNNPSNPHMFWSDQWSSKGGWKEYDRDGLDKEIISLLQAWWDGQPAGRKFTTVVRLWRIHQ